MDKIHDIRWQTRNTKLASALLCKGFILAPQPYLTTVVSSRETTTIFFLPAIKSEGEELACDAVEKLWEDAASDSYVGLPEIKWMRQALYARDHLIVTYIHPKGKVPTSGQFGGSFTTDDLNLASCLYSCGHPVLLFRDKRFHFPEAAKAEAMHFGTKTDPEHHMQWRRAVLWQQYELIGAIRSHQASKVVDIKGPGQRRAILSQSMPEPLLRRMMRELYRDQ